MLYVFPDGSYGVQGKVVAREMGDKKLKFVLAYLASASSLAFVFLAASQILNFSHNTYPQQ